MEVGVERARARYWAAWLAWYRTYNDDRASVKRTAQDMRAYVDAKAALRAYAEKGDARDESEGQDSDRLRDVPVGAALAAT